MPRGGVSPAHSHQDGPRAKFWFFFKAIGAHLEGELWKSNALSGTACAELGEELRQSTKATHQSERRQEQSACYLGASFLCEDCTKPTHFNYSLCCPECRKVGWTSHFGSAVPHRIGLQITVTWEVIDLNYLWSLIFQINSENKPGCACGEVNTEKGEHVPVMGHSWIWSVQPIHKHQSYSGRSTRLLQWLSTVTWWGTYIYSNSPHTVK